MQKLAKLLSSLRTQIRNLLLRFFGAKGFSNYLSSLENSQAYGKFCEEVYGQNLTQLNMVDKEQLEKVLEVLAMKPAERLLDLGCGIGKITEYISDTSGAEAGLNFETWDFTINEKGIWTKTLLVAEKLKAEFLREKNLDLYKSRIAEASSCIKKHDSDSAARYLYLVKVP